MSTCTNCGGLIPIQGLMTGVTLPFCHCVKPERARDPMRPMSFADIQELFGIPLSTIDGDYNAVKVLEFVRKIEKFHGIG